MSSEYGYVSSRYLYQSRVLKCRLCTNKCTLYIVSVKFILGSFNCVIIIINTAIIKNALPIGEMYY